MTVIEKLKNIFTCECPECRGNLLSEDYDFALDKVVYKCSKCGKTWF